MDTGTNKADIAQALFCCGAINVLFFSIFIATKRHSIPYDSPYLTRTISILVVHRNFTTKN